MAAFALLVLLCHSMFVLHLMNDKNRTIALKALAYFKLMT